MKRSTRAVLATLALLALATALRFSRGFFDSKQPAPMLAVLAATGLALVACGWPGRAEESRGQAGRGSLWLLAGAAVVLSGLAVTGLKVEFSQPRAEGLRLMQRGSWAGFVLVMSLLVHLAAPRRWPRLLLAQVMLLFVAGAMTRAGAVVAVRTPPIDVYVALRDAPGYLLHGQNPYTGGYKHPYPDPPKAYDAYPFYPPLPILLAVPCRAAGVDVRYANIACDLLAALAILAAGCGRGNALAGALAAGTYLHLPMAPFVIEQAWYEPMLAAALGGGLVLAERGRRLGYLLLGLGLTGKQYGVVLLPSVWMAERRRWKWLAAGLLVAMSLVCVPFVVWNWRAFYEVVYYWHTRRPVRDSLTLRTAAKGWFDYKLMGNAVWAFGFPAIAWLAWRTPQRTAAAALWVGTTLLVFCLCHTQGFANYYYLVEYLMVLGIVGLVAGEPALTAPDARDVVAG